MSAAESRAHNFKEMLGKLRAVGWDTRFIQDGFPPEKDNRTDTQKRILEAIKGTLTRTGAIVALCGPRGLGKTTIMAQFAVERGWQDFDSKYTKRVMCRYTLYRKASAIVTALKCLYADFGSIHTIPAEHYQRDLIEAEILVIDEWQETGEDSRHKDRILTDIIDRRYASLRDTVIITNQTEEEFRKTTNSSIISRLGEHGQIIECSWVSFREK
jgi:DNA replication protein DnaC